MPRFAINLRFYHFDLFLQIPPVLCSPGYLLVDSPRHTTYLYHLFIAPERNRPRAALEPAPFIITGTQGLLPADPLALPPSPPPISLSSPDCLTRLVAQLDA